MIQHNDSDTSCMRALALLERTFASEAELPPNTTIWHHLSCHCNSIAPCEVYLDNLIALPKQPSDAEWPPMV